MEAAPLHVLIVDDEPLARVRLRSLLEAQPGVVVLGDPADPTTICRTMGDAKLTLWQDGSSGEWTGARLVDLARDLEATDTQWLEQHLRGR